MNNLIQGSMDILGQGENLLGSISDKEYCNIIRPWFISSIGEHTRHLLDHYLAIRNGVASGCIDYDIRSRGSEIQTDKQAALELIKSIKQWLPLLSQDDLNTTLQCRTEVAVKQTLCSSAGTTLARELIFAASHAVHHYAVMAIAAQMQQVEVERGFGLAPATATFLRDSGAPCAP
ncbi:MAG: hypothetical protein BMS9Abin33_1209 [Gammaproteobacteria bacterium]|nr:MAG: hypothetical protein BMS9Abin33_1209 [Gammaproteobacteria bacterium]